MRRVSENSLVFLLYSRHYAGLLFIFIYGPFIGIVIKFKSQNINLHEHGSVPDNSTRIIEELPGPFRFLLQHAHQLRARKRVVLVCCLWFLIRNHDRMDGFDYFRVSLLDLECPSLALEHSFVGVTGFELGELELLHEVVASFEVNCILLADEVDGVHVFDALEGALAVGRLVVPPSLAASRVKIFLPRQLILVHSLIISLLILQNVRVLRVYLL